MSWNARAAVGRCWPGGEDDCGQREEQVQRVEDIETARGQNLVEGQEAEERPWRAGFRGSVLRRKWRSLRVKGGSRFHQANPGPRRQKRLA